MKEYLTNAHPETIENLSGKNVVEVALLAIEHFVENVEQLALRVESYLGDAVFVLPGDK